MDFDKPLKIEVGYIFYNLLMDYIDAFVYEYVSKNEGTEYPSLRISTDMILTLFNNLKKLDIDDLDISNRSALVDVSDKISELADIQRKDAVFDSRSLGLFVDEDTESKATRVHRISTDGSGGYSATKENKKEELPFIAKPLNIKDITWLKSVGIKAEKG